MPYFRLMLATTMFLVTAVFPLLADEPARVEGRVYDGNTLESLPGTTVIYGEDRGTVTDGQGRYQIEVGAGLYKITFQYVGYRTVVEELVLAAGETVVLNIALFQQLTEMEQVVISAGKLEQRLSELTVSLSIVRPEAFSSGHIADPQEMMNKSPGIEVLDGQASIRGGSGFSYGAGSRVMVLVDGLPMLSADAGSIKWQTLPLENLSQVEIIKGASSVMYGSSALNGIINFRTADATRNGINRVYAEAGFFGNPKNRDWVWWDRPPVFSSMSFSHLKKYGHTDVGLGAYLVSNEGYRKRNETKMGRVNLKLRHQCTQVRGLAYGLNANAVYNSKRDFILWENAATGALIQDESTAQLLHGSTITIDPFLHLKRSDRFTHDLRTRLQLTDNTYPDGGQNDSDARSIYAEYQLGYMGPGGFGLSAGLMQHASSIRSPFYGDHQAWNGAAYGQAEMSPLNRLRLVGGLRLEYFSLDGQGDRLTPLFRTGINYRLSDSRFVRASFGQGYRYPSIAEKHAATTLGAVKIYPNPLVQPESGWNTEIGIKQGILTESVDGLIDLAMFYSQNKDLLEFVFGIYQDPETGVHGLGFKATNIEYSRVYGFELEFLLNIESPRLRHVVSGGYVFMYPVEFDPETNKNSGVYLKFRRKHAFSVNYQTRISKFEIGVHAYARSKMLNIDDVFVNPMTREDILPGFFNYWTENNQGYFLMDASLGYQMSQLFKVSVALKNLTNTEYMGRPGDMQPHRHVSLRFSAEF